MSNPQARILIADDEPLYLRTTGDLLRKAGYDCECVPDADAALLALANRPFDLILSDLNMPGNLKLELLEEGRTRWPHIPLIVITGVPSLPTAIESIKLGITDYLLKPVKYEDLLASVRRALAQEPDPQLSRERTEDERQHLATQFPEIVGQSDAMLELFDIMDRVANTDTNILLTGESGTGKEVVARAIHRHSKRAKHHFQVIDCTAIPESLFESILFGHVKGSFTGAVKDQVGLLSQAHKGTAFFDEIGELPAMLQSKLLRVIQEQTFTPIGENKPVQIETRFLCATNRDLEWEVHSGRFRRDLFYRLAVIHLHLPPLRERGEDVLLLARHFLKRLKPQGSPVEDFSEDALSCLRRYHWPGNIRELRNIVERAIALARSSRIEVQDLPASLKLKSVVDEAGPSFISEASRDEAREAAEKSYLISLLKEHRGNVTQAARHAEMSRQGLHKLLKKHGLSAADYRE
jgi:two-component system response regulator HydG